MSSNNCPKCGGRYDRIKGTSGACTCSNYHYEGYIPDDGKSIPVKGKIAKITIAIVAVGIIFVLLNSFFMWFEGIALPFRSWFVDNVGGQDSAMRAAHESDKYFRSNGEKIEFLFEDIDAVAVKARELDVYKIEITERFVGDKTSMHRDIVFESNEGVIKVNVKPSHVPASPVDFIKAEINSLPFGTYYIITENGETYILIEADKKKSAVKVADNKTLYDKLLSYGIEKIIDYNAFKRNDVSCYEAAKVREYSTPDPDGMEGYPGNYLREYQSMPGGYYIKVDRGGYKHEIKADFYYSKVNSKIPQLSDYQ